MKIGQQECACLKFHYLGREKTGDAGTWALLSSPGPFQYSEKNPQFLQGKELGRHPQNWVLVEHIFVGTELEAASLLAPWRVSREMMKERGRGSGQVGATRVE